MRGNTKYGSNPYRGRPIPKGRIEWACEQANSAAHASRLLNVDKNTFKKYAEMYGLYEGVKNKSGKGISKGGNIYKGTHSLTDICDNNEDFKIIKFIGEEKGSDCRPGLLLKDWEGVICKYTLK